MFTYIAILFIASVLPVIIIGNYIYNKDRDKEPTYLLKNLFWGGIGCCFVAAFLEMIVASFFPEEDAMDMLQLLEYVFIGVALIEEACKCYVVYHYAYNNDAFDYFYDGIVYAVFVALGFACFENITYVFTYGITTALVRGVLSVPGHACFGVFMGYYMSLAKVASVKNHNGIASFYKTLSLLIPILLHGIFDYCLFTNNTYFLIIFFIFVYLVYKLSLKKVREISNMPFKFRYHEKYCPICGHIVNGNFCPICGHKNY